MLFVEVAVVDNNPSAFQYRLHPSLTTSNACIQVYSPHPRPSHSVFLKNCVLYYFTFKEHFWRYVLGEIHSRSPELRALLFSINLMVSRDIFSPIMDKTANGGLIIFWELYTVILCAPKHLKC